MTENTTPETAVQETLETAAEVVAEQVETATEAAAETVTTAKKTAAKKTTTAKKKVVATAEAVAEKAEKAAPKAERTTPFDEAAKVIEAQVAKVLSLLERPEVVEVKSRVEGQVAVAAKTVEPYVTGRPRPAIEVAARQAAAIAVDGLRAR